MKPLDIRRWLKCAVFVASVIIVAPLAAVVWFEKRVLGVRVLFAGLGQLLALIPGMPGAWLRGAYYFGTLEACSWETHVGFGSLFMHRGAALGRRSSMGAYCVIGHARIGADVMIASRVSIPSGKRQHLDDSGNLTSAARFDTVSIGDHTWVGEGAIILADVGRGCIVSAGAVVLKEVPDACLVGGNPARVIKNLGESGADAASEPGMG